MTMNVSLSSSFVDAQKKRKKRTIMNAGSFLSFVYRSLERKKEDNNELVFIFYKCP
jgi:hypothetical protein